MHVPTHIHTGKHTSHTHTKSVPNTHMHACRKVLKSGGYSDPLGILGFERHRPRGQAGYRNCLKPASSVLSKRPHLINKVKSDQGIRPLSTSSSHRHPCVHKHTCTHIHTRPFFHRLYACVCSNGSLCALCVEVPVAVRRGHRIP